MEVTHHSDYDTHAIMGGSQTQAFGIINSAEFITVLSSTLYSNAFLAVIREVLCNAWDAHKLIDITDRPVEILLDESQLKIRDFGPGIDPSRMTEIYCTYGGSTKKQQENQTGGFGLGSKSPFAYTNHFTVTICYDGTKTIWAISRGSADTMGMPEARIVVSVPTDETGVEVDIPINDNKDVDKFCQTINQVVKWGEINATLNGHIIDTIPISKASAGVLFTSEDPPTINGLLYVRYGNVVYPIPSHREYEELYEGATRLLKQTGFTKESYYESARGKPLNAVFEAPPNSISVTPSRESIHTSDRTIATVTKMLQDFLESASKVGGEDYLLNHEQELMDIIISNNNDNRFSLLAANPIKNYYKSNSTYYRMAGPFLSVREVVIAMACHGHWYDNESLQIKSRNQRLNRVIQNESADKDLLIKFQKLVNKEPSLWTDNYQGTRFRNITFKQPYIHFTEILRRGSAAGLNPKNFIIWDKNGYSGRKAYAGQELYKTQPSLVDLLKLTRRVILLVPDRTAIKSYEHHSGFIGWDFMGSNGGLVYVMGSRKYLSYEGTKQFFIQQGYIVLDAVYYHLKHTPTPIRIPKIEGQIEKPAPKFRKPKDQYISLLNLVHEESFYRRRHMDMDLSTAIMSDKPEAYFKAFKTRNDAHDSKFFEFSDRYAKDIVKLIGDKCVIPKNALEEAKLKSEGVKDGETYLVDYIINEITNNPKYKLVKEFSNAFDGLIQINPNRYRRLRNTLTGSNLPDLPTLTIKEETVVEIFKHLETRGNYGNLSKDNRDKLSTAWKMYSSWEDNIITNTSITDLFSEGFEDRLRVIQLRNILEDLEKDPEPRMKAFYELLLSTALFG